MKTYLRIFLFCLVGLGVLVPVACDATDSKFWGSLQPREKCILLMGHKLTVTSICRGNGVNSPFCAVSGATSQHYAQLPKTLDTVYANARFREITLPTAIHLSLLWLMKSVTDEQYKKLLDMAASYHKREDEDDLEAYQRMIENLLN